MRKKCDQCGYVVVFFKFGEKVQCITCGLIQKCNPEERVGAQ